MKYVQVFHKSSSTNFSMSRFITDRHDHGPEDDHLDSITGLSGCNKLKLVASCSADGTIRIWNEMNNLVRCVQKFPQLVIFFCSDMLHVSTAGEIVKCIYIEQYTVLSRN